jgi:hypothetical protein
MKITKYALLIAGLFFSDFLFSQTPNFDPTDFVTPKLQQNWCYTPSPTICGATPQEMLDKGTTKFLEGQTVNTSTLRLVPSIVTKGVATVGSSTASYTLTYKVDRYELRDVGNPPTKQWVQLSPSQSSIGISGSRKLPDGSVCPPDASPDYTIGPIETDGQKRCYKPLEPLDCDALQGLQPSALYDSFITGDSYTTANPPSCITKCAKDASGKERCGDCKVVAKSWGRQSVGNGQNKWWANAGTFTGTACGQNESEVPPPEAPKCWETKNGLTMCIQDPAEKCVTVNGIQQCEAGCGFINSEFYCKDKDPVTKPDPNDKDKPLPPVDDTITDPTKKTADMSKGDFKDVQKGVEGRVGQVVTGIGNLENSVDAVGDKLDKIADLIEDTNSINETGNNLLDGIKDGVDDISANSGGDGNGDGDGGGECEPTPEKPCAVDSGGVASWWKSPYPNGFAGMVQDNITDFQQSQLYQDLTTEFQTGGSAQPDFQMCFDFGFASFGCYSLAMLPWIMAFIKACFLFYAAILARRMLIGA